MSMGQLLCWPLGFRNDKAPERNAKLCIMATVSQDTVIGGVCTVLWALAD